MNTHLMCKSAVSQRVMSREDNNNTAKASCQSLVKYTQDNVTQVRWTERIFQSFVLEKASFCWLYIVVLELAAVLRVLLAAYCPDSSRPSDTIKKQRQKLKLSRADSREHVTLLSHIRFKTTSRAQLTAPKNLPEDQYGSVQTLCSRWEVTYTAGVDWEELSWNSTEITAKNKSRRKRQPSISTSTPNTTHMNQHTTNSPLNQTLPSWFPQRLESPRPFLRCVSLFFPQISSGAPCWKIWVERVVV